MRIRSIQPAVSPGSSPSARERRLDVAIAAYLQAGPAADRREFLDRYWDLTDGLVSFFANEDRVRYLVGLARPSVGVNRPTNGLKQGRDRKPSVRSASSSC